jgi:hypothetical protein
MTGDKLTKEEYAGLVRCKPPVKRPKPDASLLAARGTVRQVNLERTSLHHDAWQPLLSLT